MKKYRVGMIGSGNISGNYLRHARDVFADYYEIVAIGDLSAERAKAKAEEYGIPRHLPGRCSCGIIPEKRVRKC